LRDVKIGGISPGGNLKKFASGLINSSFPGIIPPGHPLFSRFDSLSHLQNENGRLLKENMELKKQMEKNHDSKSKNP